MANNQLAIYSGMAFGELTQQDVATIRETIGKDCNESQFKLFMSIAKNAGANPILNEIYPAVRSGQLTVQFGIDFYVRKAKETEGYQGYDVQLVHENDEFKMHQEKDEDGRYYIVIDEHSWGFPRGKVIGGYAIAYKEGFKPFTVVMEVDEVEHFKRSNIGMQKTMWTNYFNDMFKKHMVRRALKAAFNLNFDDEEVAVDGPGSDGIPEYNPARKDVTPQPEVIDAPRNSSPEQPQKSEEELKIEEAKAQMQSKFIKLGIKGAKAKQEYIAQHAPEIGKHPTYQQLVGLLDIMDMHLDMQADRFDGQDEDVLE
ncbi:RecT family recombinase [Heyndrickxia acidiproducens]|uniref:RecT family recombinase n=1 Tax=Heyndrickxia acidiproducens TaxID=1121084 RepID=UPI0003695A60|nr:RecT family recombinase [Heyndrickxia acidiproducens]